MTKGLGMMWQILPVAGKLPPLKEAIAQASQHFHAKHSCWPTLVQVNPKRLAESGIVNANVQPNQMVPATHIHLWGVPDER